MTTAQGLRKIARREWEAGHILLVRDLQVGVRFHHTYLKQPLQDWLDEQPECELANKLYIIGKRSRDPEIGHGYVDFTSMGASAPQAYRDGVGRESVVFSNELNQQIRSLILRESQMHISEVLHELESTLRYARHSLQAGIPDEDLVSYVRFEARTGLPLKHIEGAELLAGWVRSYLSAKPPRSDLMPYLI
jgi:hypothetical protein